MDELTIRKMNEDYHDKVDDLVETEGRKKEKKIKSLKQSEFDLLTAIISSLITSHRCDCGEIYLKSMKPENSIKEGFKTMKVKEQKLIKNIRYKVAGFINRNYIPRKERE